MEYEFFPTQQYLFQSKQNWINCNTVTVALYCTNVNNRSAVVLTILRSGFVGRTTECINQLFCYKFEFLRHLPPSVTHVPNVLLRRLMTTSVSENTREMPRNVSEFTSPLFFHKTRLIIHFSTDSNRYELWLQHSLYLSCNCPPCSCARGRTQLEH